MPASESLPATPQHASPNASPNDSPTNQLIVTDSCMKRIESLAEKRKDSLNEVYLRVYVDAGGCSGFQYKFEMTRDVDEAVCEEDTVFSSTSSGARVVVDAGSIELIYGSTIDFVQEMIKSGFCVVENPQSESACGCGSSFAIKNFGANPALD
jgi:iron-sulfur cluster assembly accessory protein